MIARNDDSGAGHYTAKKMTVVEPGSQPKEYRSVLSHVCIPLPAEALRCTAMPNALVEEEGIWAACGVNSKNVGMTATETITSNERVLGADPLVVLEPADGEKPEKAGGIGEEDIVVLVLPYVSSAREGAARLGSLLEEYGTYDMDGIAFSDSDEIWFLETIGGHHWIAKRVPDDSYVVMPNQQGIDDFDLEDALGSQREHMCSADLREFITANHLDLSLNGKFSARAAFGSHDDADHVYNTPRAWYMLRYFNPHAAKWEGADADYRPDSDDLPWCMVPEKKITPEDIKYILSSHYQGTPYDPYQTYGSDEMKGAFRSIGVNRTDFLGMVQIRPYLPQSCRALEWVAFASNVFNAMIPLYTEVSKIPDYLQNTAGDVSTDNLYWSSRLIAALADASYRDCINHIERYQLAVQSKAHEITGRYDSLISAAGPEDAQELSEKANEEIASMMRRETEDTLYKVLFERSGRMKNAYARSDA